MIRLEAETYSANRIIICIAVLLCLPLSPAFAAEVKNERLSMSGNRMLIEYDLGGDSETEVTLTITVQGQAKTNKDLHFEGDVGKVQPGKGKRIFWNILQDYPRGLSEDVAWNLSAGVGDFASPIRIRPERGVNSIKENISSKSPSGTWSGTVKQFNYGDYPVKMTLNNSNNGVLFGIIDYKSLKCGGKLNFIGSENNMYRFIEKITYGRCIDGGTIEVNVNNDGNLDWKWFHRRGEIEAVGSLKKE